MSKEEEIQRNLAKTAEQRFLHILRADFHYPPRVADLILEEAQNCLQGHAERLKTGQMLVQLTRQRAAHGPALAETPQVAVVWTVDAGAEDLVVLAASGPAGLRRGRIQRLLDEALEQGALATQEDLARVLQTSVRTIKRDYEALQAQGVYLPSRGYVKGIGRGQTHKAQIIRRWLHGETYDQLSANTHHAVSSIQRYLKTFVQVVRLKTEGLTPLEIAHLVQISEGLVADYLEVYAQNAEPECRERLAEQVQRLNGTATREKGAK